MKKTIIFYVLCLITAVLFFKCFFLVNKPTSYVAPIYNTMNVILGTQTKSPTDVIIKINNDFSEIPKSKNVLNKTIEGKVNSLDILIKKDFKNEIKDIIIFNDIKVYYFKDFSSFKKEEIKLCPMGNCSAYIKYEVPKSVKYNKNSKTYNYRSNINTISNIILFPMSGHFVFFIPYILLFISIIYYITNKDEIKKIKANPYIFTSLIFIFGILSYSNGLLDYLPWDDEYRTLDYANPDKSILETFNDGGNPPVFYIIFRWFLGFFGISQLTMRAFPLIIAILFSVVFWIFLKKKYDLKIANIGLFLIFINVPLTYFAQETRSYIMQAFMTPIIIYYLFKILEESKKRDYIIYGILVGIASNIHYYEILFLFSNFVFAIFYLFFKKKYKDILKFTCANFIGGLFFLPFFISTAFNKALTDSTFNNWIPDINYFQIKKCVFYLFGGGISLLISLVLFVYNLFKKEKNILLIYSFFAIIFTVFLAVFLSYAIRPLLVERYLILLVPLFVIFICSFFANSGKNKYAVIFFIIWILFIQANSFEKANRKKGVLEMPLSYSKQYFDLNKNEDIYAIINLSNPEYLENKGKLMNDDIKYVSTSITTVDKEIKAIFEKDKNAIIFTSILPPDDKYNDNYTCYFNSSSDMCLWRIEND